MSKRTLEQLAASFGMSVPLPTLESRYVDGCEHGRWHTLSTIGQHLIRRYGINATHHEDNSIPSENAQLVAALLLEAEGMELLSKIASIHNHKGSLVITLKVNTSDDVLHLWREVLNRAGEATSGLGGFCGVIVDARGNRHT